MIEGIIVFKQSNVGSKSQGTFPYLSTEQGELIKVRMLNENPFEHNTLQKYEGKSVALEGEFNDNGTFLVTELHELTPSDGVDAGAETEAELEVEIEITTEGESAEEKTAEAEIEVEIELAAENTDEE